MSLDPMPIRVLLLAFALLHPAVPVIVLIDRLSWTRKVAWLLVVCSVPLLGPVFYLLFRQEWRTPTSTAKDSSNRTP